jgi:hypothetical protein
MANICLEVGMGQSNGYIGAQPPLNPEHIAMLQEASDKTIPTAFVESPKFAKGKPYSVCVEPVNRHDGSQLETEVFVTEAALKIAEVFRSNGLDVELEDYTQWVGGPYFLFGCRTEANQAV